MSIRSRSLITGSICSCPLCVDSAVVPRTTLFFLDDPVCLPRGSDLVHCEQYITRNSRALSFRLCNIVDLPEVREKSVSS